MINLAESPSNANTCAMSEDRTNDPNGQRSPSRVLRSVLHSLALLVIDLSTEPNEWLPTNDYNSRECEAKE